ncbi:LYR motif-containing protein 1 isoform X6 [Lontra canadensis]|uniref:LYR motif-containing protein 1 isoform X6 n=1 Tax=Lontra canadensis TaxID=76717 RepID=UPI0013F3A185|nr:LYR motif-containing protein 1 isoform X6 [Lontra canadensis]
MSQVTQARPGRVFGGGAVPCPLCLLPPPPTGVSKCWECPSCAKHWTRHGGYKMSETKTGSLKDVSELDGKQCKIAIGLTDTDQIKQCIDECTARIEIGLHYQIPYPRPIHLPPMGLTPLRGRGLRSQEKLRKLSKPVYLKSHDEIS